MVDLKMCPTCLYPTSNTAILLFHPPQQFFGEQNEKINDRLKREHARALFFPTRQKHNVMKWLAPTSFCKTCRPNLVLTKWFAQSKRNPLRDGNKLTGHKSLQNVSFFMTLCSEIYMGPTISKWKCTERYNLCAHVFHIFWICVSWVGTADEHVRICFNISTS